MDDDRWCFALLNAVAFLLCVGFLVYVLWILRPFLRRRDTVPGSRTGFDFHFVVPCLDEEQVVEGTVRHLVGSFPGCTVWCVDDGSTDRTPAILAALEAELAALRVVTRVAPAAREGKGAALNAAWRAVDAALPDGTDRDRVIVGVLDADARLERVCPDMVCSRTLFGDGSVVAVQVMVRVTDDVDALVSSDPSVLAAGVDPTGRPGGGRTRGDTMLVQLQDMEFTGPIAAMQILRQRTGSVGMGGNGQFTRMSGLDRIAVEHGTPWHGALLEDFELGLHVLLTGARTAYCDDTFVAQTGLDRVRPLVRQRSRWSQGGMQCLRYLWPVLCSPQVPLSGALEIGYYLYLPWSQLVGSVVFPATLALDAWFALHTAGGPADWWATGAWGLAPLALLFGALPNLIWGPMYRVRSGGTVTRRRALLLGVAFIGYGYLLQVAVWWALVRLLRGHGDWKKTAHCGSRSPGVGPRPSPAARIPEELTL